MALREEFADLGRMTPPTPATQGNEYVVVGYGQNGEPVVRPGPGVSDLTGALLLSQFGTKPIPLSQFKSFLADSKTHAFNKAGSAFMNSPAGIAAQMLIGGRSAGRMPSATGGAMPGGVGRIPPRSPIPGSVPLEVPTQTATGGGRGIPGAGPGIATMPQGGPIVPAQTTALGPPRVPPGAPQLPGPVPAPARVIPEPRLPGPQQPPVAGAMEGSSFNPARVIPEARLPGPTARGSAPNQMGAAQGLPAPGPAPNANQPPGVWGARDPGGLSGSQAAQLDTAAGNIAQGFGAQPMVPPWLKAVGAGAGLAGGAALAGSLAGRESAPTAGGDWSVVDTVGNAMRQIFGDRTSLTPPPSQPPSAPIPAGKTASVSVKGKSGGRGAAGGVGGAGAPGGAGASGGQQFGYAPPPRAPALNYYSDMLGAADSGDAYARDLVNLTGQARQVAFKAQQEGQRFQFVPLHDVRNNRLYLVNANGQDVVLDLNDEGDKAAFGRMTNKIGIDPASVMAWARGSSAPLMRYMAPPGAEGQWAPQFAQPGSQVPQVGAAASAEPMAGEPPMQLPNVPKFAPGAPLPSMRGLNVTADRPLDERMAEIQKIREQGFGNPQLDEIERQQRALRISNPDAYARPMR